MDSVLAPTTVKVYCNCNAKNCGIRSVASYTYMRETADKKYNNQYISVPIYYLIDTNTVYHLK